ADAGWIGESYPYRGSCCERRVGQCRVSRGGDGCDGCEGGGTEAAAQRGLFGRSPAFKSHEQLGLGCAPSETYLSIPRSVPLVWVRSGKGDSVTAILPGAHSARRQGPVYRNGAAGSARGKGL